MQGYLASVQGCHGCKRMGPWRQRWGWKGYSRWVPRNFEKLGTFHAKQQPSTALQVQILCALSLLGGLPLFHYVGHLRYPMFDGRSLQARAVAHAGTKNG